METPARVAGMALVSLTLSGCEIWAHFDRDKIDQSQTRPPVTIPTTPMVPPEMDASLPDDELDASAEAGMDGALAEDGSAHDQDAEAEDAGVDAGDAGDDGGADAGSDADAATDAGRDAA
jgi:hypothetical protein